MEIDISTPSHPNKFCFIDDDDAHLVTPFKWTYSSTGYARRICAGKNVSMHRVIMGSPKDLCVDHINGNTLDNRKSNLRTCTKMENCRNQKTKGSSSKYKGVSVQSSRGKWQVKIRSMHKTIFVGRFDDEREAALAYDKAAILYHGQYAKTNAMLGLI